MVKLVGIEDKAGLFEAIITVGNISYSLCLPYHDIMTRQTSWMAGTESLRMNALGIALMKWLKN